VHAATPLYVLSGYQGTPDADTADAHGMPTRRNGELDLVVVPVSGTPQRTAALQPVTTAPGTTSDAAATALSSGVTGTARWT
jgi:hypothetical protein